ncbi:MAG: tetratricopeptide repeat protein, partial [Bacteroidales bacterium]|nr:tetratricopeptide repeat protein [Bacteroidales bacterium]
KYVFGHFPLQNYLVEFPGGRLQTLALTWNSIDNEWFYMADSVYKEMSVTHTNWLHWTNQAQNWNSMCADCHSTDLKKAYDLASDTYHTTWSEIDVSCEACHGPSSEHLKWANLAEYARKDFVNYGLPIKTSGIDNKQYVDNCARCHSRRATLTDFDGHSQSIYNHIIPSIPNEPNWHIDGQIKEEDYVYASFTQSRMFMNDIKCNDCHNVHSGKLVLEGNALCLQCHKADDYGNESHTFHKGYGEKGESVISDAGVKFDVGSGTECINCHMHGQNFMGIDYRRDHSFRIPRPDLSEKNGTPNACNQCHTDKSNQWSQGYIEKWFGKSRPFQFGEAFTAANNQDIQADDQLKRIINDDLYPTSIRSIALGYLSSRDENDKLIDQYLLNMEPSLRINAVNGMYLNSEDDLEKLLPLLYDETKAVRMEVAQRLSFLDTTLIPNNYKEAFKDALSERFEVLEYNADFPIGKYNLANYYYQEKDYEKAEFYYLSALEQDGELNFAKMNLANLYSAMGKPLEAEKILKEYVLENPNDGNANYNYGLILSENRKYEESLEYLLNASELMPSNGRIFYNIAMLYDFFGDEQKAEKYLKKAIENDESNATNYSNLLQYYTKKGYDAKAEILAREIKQKFE